MKRIILMLLLLPLCNNANPDEQHAAVGFYIVKSVADHQAEGTLFTGADTWLDFTDLPFTIALTLENKVRTVTYTLSLSLSNPINGSVPLTYSLSKPPTPHNAAETINTSVLADNNYHALRLPNCLASEEIALSIKIAVNPGVNPCRILTN